MSSLGRKGFTLVEALVIVAILSTVTFVALTYSSVTAQNTNVSRYISTKNRVLATIRESASMPSALRASMLAATGNIPVNPQLLACAGGNPLNACKSGVETALILFSPIFGRDPSGAIVGVQAISAPMPLPPGTPSTAKPMRVDSFGNSCQTASAECSLLIYTSMIPQCGPAPKPATPPAKPNDQVVPLDTCTYADVIQVNFRVEVDPDVAATEPTLASAMPPVSGSVTVSVKDITNNLPK